MIRNRPAGFAMGMLFVVFVASANLLAEEAEYESDMAPGLTVRSDNSTLAEAARTGQSVRIEESEGQGEAEPAYAPAGEAYTVREGDTLWQICDRHFGDPYAWPRVWSYNQKITNPNWIYPGDVIWLSSEAAQQGGAAGAGDGAGAAGAGDGAGSADGSQQQRQQVLSRMPSSTFMRNHGFIDKEALERAGILVGANKAIQLLGQYNEAYVDFSPEDEEDGKKKKKKKKEQKKKPIEVHVGDQFVIFKVVGAVTGGVDDPDSEIGKLVEIVGGLRVTQFNKENRIARVLIEESTKEIERGALVGIVENRFKMVPPAKNNKDIEARLVAILEPNSLAADHQIVFVDRGLEHGVREGNRFFAVEVRDRWRASRGKADDREGYPTEVLAEIRVIEARPQTSTCVITSSIRELKVGQKLVMRKGY
jgi:hypothetical protein